MFHISGNSEGLSHFLVKSFLNVEIVTHISSVPICFKYTDHEPFSETFKFIIEIDLNVFDNFIHNLLFFHFFDDQQCSYLNSFVFQIPFNYHKSPFSEVFPFFTSIHFFKRLLVFNL